MNFLTFFILAIGLVIAAENKIEERNPRQIGLGNLGNYNNPSVLSYSNENSLDGSKKFRINVNLGDQLWARGTYTFPQQSGSVTSVEWYADRTGFYITGTLPSPGAFPGPGASPGTGAFPGPGVGLGPGTGTGIGSGLGPGTGTGTGGSLGSSGGFPNWHRKP